jgi:uncharacterized OB-fold protein
VALVDLDEGFRLLTETLNDDGCQVAIGQRVRLNWDTYEEFNVPVFRTSKE